MATHRRTTALATVTLLAAFAAGTRAQPTESVWEASSGLSPEQVCPAWTLVDTAPGADPTATSSTAPAGAASSSTAVTGPSTSTTIALPNGCDDVTPGSLDAVRCRLNILAVQIAERQGLGSFRAKLQSTLARAIMRAQEGDDACTAGDTKTARRRMKQTNRFLLNMAHRLSLLRARKQLDPGLRADLIMMIESIRSEVGALRRTPCS
jgi:hypothetical protein